VLIDAGYKQFGGAVSAKIKPYIDGALDYVIATHSHADHVGGLTQIYADYDVKHTIYGDTGTSQQYKNYENAAKTEPGATFKNDEKETINLAAGVTMSILDPTDTDSNTNNNSVITILNANGIKTIITGDAEAKTENLILGQIGDVGIYIVGHHGSETSSSQPFLNEIKPEHAIISSVGPEGKYANPNPGVIERLLGIGSKIYGTHISGDITATIKDGKITISY
jgi:beta-lactamase superfamily II metal-dependent hydrolase